MIGVVSPSTMVPANELVLGVQKLKKAGFDVRVHPICKKKWFLFSGTHEERARAFYETAKDPNISVLWCARGGYGAGHLLPLLEEMSRLHGIPEGPKLLAGYSDSTALFEFVRNRWGWSVLHAPMIARKQFLDAKGQDWKTLTSWIRKESAPVSWKKNLKWLTPKPKGPIEGMLSGGNLAVWSSLLGTGFLPRSGPPILFLEEIGETPNRIDRLIFQLRHAGGLEGVRALILGDFTDCDDRAPKGLRARLPATRVMAEIFGTLGKEMGFAVATGLPVGHGKGGAALPIGGRYRLSPSGALELLDWDWLRG